MVWDDVDLTLDRLTTPAAHADMEPPLRSRRSAAAAFEASRLPTRNVSYNRCFLASDINPLPVNAGTKYTDWCGDGPPSNLSAH